MGVLILQGTLLCRVNWWDAPQDPNVWQKHHVSTVACERRTAMNMPLAPDDDARAADLSSAHD
jgi:hypothetical protein